MTHCTSWLHAVFEGSLYVPFEELCHNDYVEKLGVYIGLGL